MRFGLNLFDGILGPKWQRSENGNLTTVFRGQRVTLFESGRLWKYAVANIEAEDAEFSDGFETMGDAKSAALFREFGIGTDAVSKSERRAEQYHRTTSSIGFKKGVLDDLEKLKKRFAKDTKRVDVAANAAPEKLRIKTLAKDLQAGMRAGQKCVLNAIDGDIKAVEAEGEQIRDAYFDLMDRLTEIEAKARSVS